MGELVNSKLGFVGGVLLGASLLLGCSAEAESGSNIRESMQALTIDEWSSSAVYAPGDLVEFQGITYRAVQGHSAQAGWVPPVVPALWEVVEVEAEPGDPGVVPPTNVTLIGLSSPPTLDEVTLLSDCAASPDNCCPRGSTPKRLTDQPDTAQILEADQCVLAGKGADTLAIQVGGSSALHLGPGDDTAQSGSGDDLIMGGPGRDTIMAYGGTNLLFGGPGDDIISAANGTNTVVPGPGLDIVALGTGDDTVYIFDECEVDAGETIDGGSGNDTLVIPVPLSEMEAAGLTVVNFENIIVERNGCRSECVSDKPACANGLCVEGAERGDLSCECGTYWTGDLCEISVEGRTPPGPSASRSPQPRRGTVSHRNLMGPGVFTGSGGFLTPAVTSGPGGVIVAALPPSVPMGFTPRMVTPQLTLRLDVDLHKDKAPQTTKLFAATTVDGNSEIDQDVALTNTEVVIEHSVTIAPGSSIASIEFRLIEPNGSKADEIAEGEFTVDLVARTFSGTLRSIKRNISAATGVKDTILDTKSVSGNLGDEDKFTFYGDNSVRWSILADPVFGSETVDVCAHWTTFFVEDPQADINNPIGRPYSASFASYEIIAAGLGGTFRGEGRLDIEGCLADPIPVAALAYEPGNSQVNTGFLMKVQSDLEMPASAGGAKFSVKDSSGGFVKFVLKFDEFKNPDKIGASWSQRGELLYPPSRFDVAPDEQDGNTTAAGSISVMMSRLIGENVVVPEDVAVELRATANAGTRDYACREILDSSAAGSTLSLGQGFIPRENSFNCNCSSDADCTGAANGKCDPIEKVCTFDKTDFSAAQSCALGSNSCKPGQFCASTVGVVPEATPGACAASDPECVCAYQSQAMWKFVNAHEMGHVIQNISIGLGVPSGDYTYMCPGGDIANCGTHGTVTTSFGRAPGALEDPPDINPICGCSHVDAANGLHCLQSAEITPAAQGEGFGQYFASLMWNDPAASECEFQYYKEFVDDDGVVQFPPMKIDCALPRSWRNRLECVVEPGDNQPGGFVGAVTSSGGVKASKPIMGTEYDWMTFLYSLRNEGIRLSDVLSMYRYTARAPTACNFDTDCPSGLCSAAKTCEVLGAGEVEPAPTALVEQAIYWKEDLNKGRLGIIDGAQRKWGKGSTSADAVEVAADRHGVSDVVP